MVSNRSWALTIPSRARRSLFGHCFLCAWHNAVFLSLRPFWGSSRAPRCLRAWQSPLPSWSPIPLTLAACHVRYLISLWDNRGNWTALLRDAEGSLQCLLVTGPYHALPPPPKKNQSCLLHRDGYLRLTVRVVYRDCRPAPTHSRNGAARPAPQGWSNSRRPSSSQALPRFAGGLFPLRCARGPGP